MQVPGLIDLLGRRNDVAGCNGQEEEFFVFNDDALGIFKLPAVFAGQSASEGELRGGLVDLKGHHPVEQNLLRSVHDGPPMVENVIYVLRRLALSFRWFYR